MKRRLLIIVVLTLTGCVVTDISGSSDVMNPPELLNPPPRMPLRVGLYTAPQVREYETVTADSSYDIGGAVYSAAVEQSERAFESLTILGSLPQPGSRKDLDLIVAIKSANVQYGGIFAIDCKLALEFDILLPSGQKLDSCTEEATMEFQAGLDAASRTTEAIRILCRATVLKFLRNLRKRNDILAARRAPDQAHDGAAGRMPERTAIGRSETDAEPAGIRLLEQEIGFNVLDYMVFDPNTCAVSLVGHWDDAYAGPPIPYLQHLTTLLEDPEPMFALRWTDQAKAQVEDLFRKMGDADECARLVAQWTANWEGETPLGNARLVLPTLGIRPVKDGKAPGDLGAEVAFRSDDSLLVTSVAPGSAADRAGLKVGDGLHSTSEGQPINQFDLVRLMRRAGAGTVVTLSVLQEQEFKELTATLEAAAGDPWEGFERTDFLEQLFRLGGEEKAAEVMAEVGLGKKLEGYSADEVYMATVRLMATLDVLDDYNRLFSEMHEGKISKTEAEIALNRAVCQAYDSMLGFSNMPAAGAFDNMIANGTSPGSALGAAIDAADPELMALQQVCLDRIYSRPEGIQIPTELIMSTFGADFTVTPDFKNLDPQSQLARSMCEGDYLLKSLLHAPSLSKVVPNYMTDFAFAVANPDKSPESMRHGGHFWISVAGLDLVESSDGRCLALRDAKMQVNYRMYGPGKEDLPAIAGGYHELLTGLYDDLSRVFPILHELRECAKLAGAARWLRGRKADIRIPAQGQCAWSAPASLPGAIHMFQRKTGAGSLLETTAYADGGVDLTPPAVEVRRNESFKMPVIEPQVYKNTALERVLAKKIEVPEWRPEGWVARATKGERTREEFEQVLTVIANSKSDLGEAAYARGRIEEGLRLASALEAIEGQMNLLTKKGVDRTAEFERLNKSLTEAETEFRESATDLLDRTFNTMAGRMKEMRAQGLVESETLTDEFGAFVVAFDEFRNRYKQIQTGLAAVDAETRREALKQLSKLALDIAKDCPETFGPLNKAVVLKDVAEMADSLWTLGSAAAQMGSLTENADAENAKLRDLILPIHKRLSDKLDAVRNDPVVKKLAGR
ncbi:MAG: PDZ domain-containing protein [Planctomycetota bacterium]|nr:PDZ domain-containing protein [Planctomycetota bacterium]